MTIPDIPYDALLSFRCTERGPGDVVVDVDVDERYHNPMGVVHGGVLCGLIDSAMGASIATLLEPGWRLTNVDLHVRFLRPTVAGRLRAEARIVRRGATVVVMEASVFNRDGDEVARGSSTFLLKAP